MQTVSIIAPSVVTNPPQEVRQSEDGNWYSKAEFFAFFGGSAEWEIAAESGAAQESVTSPAVTFDSVATAAGNASGHAGGAAVAVLPKAPGGRNGGGRHSRRRQ